MSNNGVSSLNTLFVSAVKEAFTSAIYGSLALKYLPHIQIYGYTELSYHRLYRDELKCSYVLLSRTQAGPGRAVKQEQAENSPNQVQAF